MCAGVFSDSPPCVPAGAQPQAAALPLWPHVLMPLSKLFLKEVQLPELDVESWLVFTFMGAYPCRRLHLLCLPLPPPSAMPWDLRLRCPGGERVGSGESSHQDLTLFKRSWWLTLGSQALDTLVPQCVKPRCLWLTFDTSLCPQD